MNLMQRFLSNIFPFWNEIDSNKPERLLNCHLWGKRTVYDSDYFVVTSSLSNVTSFKAPFLQFLPINRFTMLLCRVMFRGKYTWNSHNRLWFREATRFFSSLRLSKNEDIWKTSRPNEARELRLLETTSFARNTTIPFLVESNILGYRVFKKEIPIPIYGEQSGDSGLNRLTLTFQLSD